MSTVKPKVDITTSTDLHLDLLADPTKIKPQLKNISLDNISEKSDDEDSHVIEKLQQHIANDSSSRKSSKSSKSSNISNSSSKSSKISNSSSPSVPKNLFTPKIIPFPVLPTMPEKPQVPVEKPQTNFFANFFGGGGGLSAPPAPVPVQPPVVTAPTNSNPPPNNYSFPSNIPKDNYDSLPEDKKRLRRLQKFAELKYIKDTYKIQLTREFTYNSEYHEMCAEIEFHRANISKKNSVEFMKSAVFGSVGMIDKLNKMFDPFGLKDTMDGFPEHLQVTTGDSEIYEELAEKYKGKFKEYSVEMRFMLLMVGSAAGFIATKKAADNIPFFNNLDEGTKKEIMKNLSKNIQSNIVPQSLEQKNKAEEDKILHFMMQQKKQEEEKAQRMQNVFKQHDEHQKNINLTNKKIDPNILLTSSIDSEDSTLNDSNE
jgi:hypothetical protein